MYSKSSQPERCNRYSRERGRGSGRGRVLSCAGDGDGTGVTAWLGWHESRFVARLGHTSGCFSGGDKSPRSGATPCWTCKDYNGVTRSQTSRDPDRVSSLANIRASRCWAPANEIPGQEGKILRWQLSRAPAGALVLLPYSVIPLVNSRTT